MNDEATLAALRFGDSFLPVGAFTLSYGVEGFVESGRVESAEDLRVLLESYLDAVLGPGDLVALRAAHDGATENDIEGICVADRRLHATTLAAELRESATRSGERLLRLEGDLRDRGTAGENDPLEAYAKRVPENAPGTHAAVLGVATASKGVPVREACLLYCHSFVTGLLGAAQRLMSLGHTEVQDVLATVRPAMSTAVETSAERSLGEMSPFAPSIDIHSAEHERADRRLFVS